MSKFLFIFILLLMAACSANSDNRLELMLKDNAISLDDGNRYLLLVNETNCMDCIGFITSKIENIKKEKVVGVYYGNEKLDGYTKLKKITAEYIAWNVVKNDSLYMWAAEKTGSISGPYILEFEQKKLKNIALLRNHKFDE